MSKAIKIVEDTPDLSIIVSMYNEEDGIDVFFERVKESLNKLSSYTYEIVCIDDGSLDNTFELLQ